MSKQYTVAEVAQHKDESSGMWLIVDSGVYDVTSKCFPNHILASHSGECAHN